jgi:carbamoyltransferase
VLRDRAHEYFELNPDVESPYMLLVAQVREDKRLGGSERGATGLDRIQSIRSVVPAITHVDYSARIQTVDRGRNPRLFDLLEAFASRTGCPLMINTSFNIRGEPVVCTPQDAFRCFMATQIDVLVIDDFLLLKEQQPASARPNPEAYLSRYQKD